MQGQFTANDLRDIDLGELRDLAASIDEFSPQEAAEHGLSIVQELVAKADAEPDAQQRARLRRLNVMAGAMFYRRTRGDCAMPPWASQPPMPN